MGIYTNHTRNTGIDSMEFTPISNGNFSFVYVDSPAKVDLIKEQMTRPDIGQQIVAQTIVKGRPALIMQGPLSQDELLKKLYDQGERLEFHREPKKMNAWAIRAALGFAGQGLQITSSLMRPDRKLDWSLFMFAVPNIIANCIAVSFGAQEHDDKNRLLFLKEKFSDNLSPYNTDGSTLPTINEDRSSLHPDHKNPTLKEHAQGFIARNSVNIGEILLRYFGALSLAFPVDRYKKAIAASKEGGFKAGYLVHRNPNDISHFAGLASISGKTLALTSKINDPYDPKPHSFLDGLREKFTFRAGGWIEAAAFSSLAFDAVSNKKISFTKGGKEHHDFISGLGAAMFTAGYVIRNWAPYGKMKFDMEELNAHIVDTLAHMPPDKLPQLLADTAASVAEHFKDKKLDFGAVYTQLVTDLYRYHHIAIKNNLIEGSSRTIVQEAVPVQPVLDLDKNLSQKASFADRIHKRTTEDGLVASRG